MAVPKYISNWFDALPEEEKRATMERLSKALEEGFEEITRKNGKEN